MPQIQEPDERFWTALRVVFVALSAAGVIYLGTLLFVTSPTPDPAEPASAPAAPTSPPTETP